MGFCCRICKIFSKMDRIAEYKKCDRCNIYHAEEFCPLCTYKEMVKEIGHQIELITEIIKKQSAEIKRDVLEKIIDEFRRAKNIPIGPR